ncbi:MAG: hypothetical protein ACHQM6_05905, partial [Candidatus Kapaibacterium sp.]
SYYTILVPAAKGKTIRWRYALEGLLYFILLRCWLATAILSILPVKAFFQKKRESLSLASLYFGLFFAMSILAGFFGILNFGGGHNVLIPAAAACALFLPILVSELSVKRRVAPYIVWLLPVQIAFLLSNPWKDSRNIATESDKKNQEEFFHYTSLVKGEVWVQYHGYLGKYNAKAAYADIAAVRDVLLVDGSASHDLRSQLDSALSGKHWSLIISDLRDTIPQYVLTGTMKNLNKSHLNDDTLLYLYKPEE